MYTCSREILKDGRILDQTLTCSFKMTMVYVIEAISRNQWILFQQVGIVQDMHGFYSPLPPLELGFSFSYFEYTLTPCMKSVRPVQGQHHSILKWWRTTKVRTLPWICGSLGQGSNPFLSGLMWFIKVFIGYMVEIDWTMSYIYHVITTCKRTLFANTHGQRYSPKINPTKLGQ